MFEDYKRLTDRNDSDNMLCVNCMKYRTSGCSDSLDCAEELSRKLNQFENALENGRLIELTEERITALIACLHAASTNRKVEEATYTKFNRSGGKINIERQMRYDKAIELLAGLLENLSDKEEETEK